MFEHTWSDDRTIRITAYEYELELYKPMKIRFPWNLFPIK